MFVPAATRADSRRLDTVIERAANVFARELLMPEEVVRWLYSRGFYAPR